ncbi:MAG: cryptochrome DASH, partial [Microcystis aeruginosa Ma_AC_P_19900807_S299]
TSYGFPKTGKFRAKFLLESVANLRQSLESLGGNLIIRRGKPEELIPQLVQELQIAKVYYHQEVTAEELAVEKAVNKALSGVPVQIKNFWTATLYHPDDLPFTLNQLPELFTNFRKQVERHWEIRTTYPTPKNLTKLPKIELGNLPSLNDLGEYIWDSDSLKTYKETRNEMSGTNYSSKFSAWLSFGCLSPRYIYEEVQKYEQTRVKNDSTYWLIFELLWRDFFRFICSKHGNKIFYKSGLQELYLPWLEDWERFNLWCEGKTGYPLVDANMRELAATGFMSNRGRQNVASFLSKNLGIDWCMGAEWFESLLIDYDVCSYFNIPKQSKDYDPKGDYLRHWLPELALIKGDKIHEPYKLYPEEQKRYGVILGVNYPRPIVDFFQSIKHNEKIYLQHFSEQ